MTPQQIASQLPDPADLERFAVSIAALDAVMSPEQWLRLYSYNPSPAPGARLASMRDGMGDDYQMVFTALGSVVRAFDHESSLSPWSREDGGMAPGLLDGFPSVLRPLIENRALRLPGAPSTDLTFCAWRLGRDLR